MIQAWSLEILVSFLVLSFLGLLFNQKIVFSLGIGGMVLTLILQAVEELTQVVGNVTVIP